MTPVVSIIGESNSGKTTLIEKIIKEIKKQNYKVGLIKHDVHKFEVDYPGKDTWRMSKAGGDTVIISSKEKLAMVKRVDKEYKPNKIINEFIKGVDIVITEGYKNEKYPKIVVIKRNGSENNFFCRKKELLAVVSNKDVPLKGITVFNFNQFKALAKFIIRQIIKIKKEGKKKHTCF